MIGAYEMNFQQMNKSNFTKRSFILLIVLKRRRDNMEREAVKKLRKRQLILTNILLLLILSLYFFIVLVFALSTVQMNTIVAVCLFLYALYGYVRKNKATSFIPTFEKVAIYEKEKMGEEWNKQRKTNVVSLFILSGIMLLNAFISQGIEDAALTIELLPPILILLVIIVLVTNVFLMIHIRKVDRSRSQTDFAGYTLQTNLIGIVASIGIVFVMFILILLYFIFID